MSAEVFLMFIKLSSSRYEVKGMSFKAWDWIPK